MKRDFGDLLSGAWTEYKANFKTFFMIIFLLSIIPAIILFFVQPDLTIVKQDPLVIFSLPYIIVMIISIILSLIMGVSLIYFVINNKKGEMSYGGAIKGGLSYFWKYLGLVIVMMVFLGLLFLLLIVPGIIFMVFWIFAFYVLIAEDKGIMGSLSRSKEIVKGRWWRVFGYSILFFLVLAVISLVVLIPTWIIGGGLLSTIIAQIGTIIITPLSALFYKNFYYDLAGKK